MASRKLSDLTPEVRRKASRVKRMCKEAGFDLLIYCTLRTLEEQARLFRQSRTWEEITSKIAKFDARGLHFLSKIIMDVGPCYGRHTTNAAPGESWHSYGKAWDAVPVIGGKLAWVYGHSITEWDIYGKYIREVGMSWAGNWSRFIEYPHAQLGEGSNPLKLYRPDNIHGMLVEHKLIKKGD